MSWEVIGVGPPSAGTTRAPLSGAGGVRIIERADTQVVYGLPAAIVIARARIDLASPVAQPIVVLAGIDAFEVETVSFRAFDDVPVGAQGGIYAEPPVNGVLVPDDAIVLDTTNLSSGRPGSSTIRPNVIPSLRTVEMLWWCPRQVSSTPVTCEVEIVAVPKHQGEFDPNIGLPTGVATVSFGDSYTARPDSYINLLAADLGWTLTNRGSSGTVLQNSPDATGFPRDKNGLDNLISRLAGVGPQQLVVDAYGGFNDGRYTGSPLTFNVTEFIKDKRSFINILRERGFAPEQILSCSIWYPTDATLATASSEEFIGATRQVILAYWSAMFMIAREYGVLFYDPYTYVRDRNPASLFTGDKIHMNAAGNQALADVARTARRLNRLGRPRDIKVASPGTGKLAFAATPPRAAVASYTVEWGIDGSHAYPNSAVVAAAVGEITGVPPGTYRVRMHATHAIGGESPWEFAAAIVTVS